MEERNIKISIEKAREWYSYGGELKKTCFKCIYRERNQRECVTQYLGRIF